MWLFVVEGCMRKAGRMWEVSYSGISYIRSFHSTCQSPQHNQSKQAPETTCIQQSLARELLNRPDVNPSHLFPVEAHQSPARPGILQSTRGQQISIPIPSPHLSTVMLLRPCRFPFARSEFSLAGIHICRQPVALTWLASLQFGGKQDFCME